MKTAIFNRRINNDAGDWWTFAEYIIEGRDASAVYKLNADLSDISMTIGSEDYPFRGVFNGDGHTLAVDIEETANRDGSAPFRAVCGATIQNLTVTGNVSGHTNTGGLVGLALGNADDDTETNTISNVTIKASIDGYSCGGIVAHAKNSKLILSDCQVEGTLSCSRYYAGGFQGWSDGNTITITNCLFKETLI